MSVLSETTSEPGPKAFGMAGLFILAMAAGSALSLFAPSQAETVASFTDATLLTLIFLLFFEVRFASVARAFGNYKFLTLAWVANFLIIPAIGFGIASLLLSGQPLLFAGLMIYLLAPCTDWFLGFTLMARGDTEMGAALIPVNLISQLLLFPVWLWLFTPANGIVDFSAMPGLLLQWFIIPMAAAQGTRFLIKGVLSAKALEVVKRSASTLSSAVLGFLIVQLFASHVDTIFANSQLFGIVAVAVVFFFALTFIAGHMILQIARLRYEEHALLTMTMAARNAPLMLALTAVAIPNQPLVLAVIVFGMLVEIPHLTLLRQLLLIRSNHLSSKEAHHVLCPQ